MLPVAIIAVLLHTSQAFNDDPETYMGAFEIIKRWDYPAELHEVITPDGYILDLFRIPYGRQSERNSSCIRPPILLVHGLAAGSATWVLNPPESCPAFLLADAGFDVFLLNHRGTTYAKRHTTLSPWNNKFWQFTLDDLIKYDHTATIDKVLKITGQKALYYVGHSQGTVTGLLMLADFPAYNEKVLALFELGPIYTGYYVGGLVGGLVSILRPIVEWIRPVTDFYRVVFGSHEAAWQWSFIYRPLIRLCDIPVAGPWVCANVPKIMFGPSTHPWNHTRLPVYISHIPGSTSTWNALQWGQNLVTNRLDHMDHNPLENIQRYGTEHPPEYNFTNINTPVYLFWSQADWLTTAKEVNENLIPRLRKEIVTSIELEGYDHTDYMVAHDIRENIFDPIAQVARREVPNMCLA